MTPRQRLAFLILQINYGYTAWGDTLRLARGAALGCSAPEARAASDAVRAALRAADAAMATIARPETVGAA